MLLLPFLRSYAQFEDQFGFPLRTCFLSALAQSWNKKPGLPSTRCAVIDSLDSSSYALRFFRIRDGRPLLGLLRVLPISIVVAHRVRRSVRGPRVQQSARDPNCARAQLAGRVRGAPAEGHDDYAFLPRLCSLRCRCRTPCSHGRIRFLGLD